MQTAWLLQLCEPFFSKKIRQIFLSVADLAIIQMWSCGTTDLKCQWALLQLLWVLKSGHMSAPWVSSRARSDQPACLFQSASISASLNHWFLLNYLNHWFPEPLISTDPHLQTVGTLSPSWESLLKNRSYRLLPPNGCGSRGSNSCAVNTRCKNQDPDFWC